MSETIWRATDNDGRCWYYGEKPDWSEHQFYSQDGRVLEYYGTEKPPPGECWEMTVTRKGDIDTDGEPIGWKIVGVGRDGSVLCEKGNGQRRRYSFGDWAKEQPSGEAWERLTKERDEARTERHAYKSRLREFCQRLVDMVGAEGPEDVQGMLDKVNAEINRLKQSIDSLSANLADKEGFLNSAGDEIEVLTKERDEALRELANERSRSGQVTTAQINVIAELQAKLERPEMPECVAKLLQTFQPVGQSLINAVQTVRDHYAPPFRIDKLGVYATEKGNPWEVIYIDPKGGVVARHETTKLLENFHVSGACKGGPFSLTKYLRPLEG